MTFILPARRGLTALSFSLLLHAALVVLPFAPITGTGVAVQATRVALAAPPATASELRPAAREPQALAPTADARDTTRHESAAAAPSPADAQDESAPEAGALALRCPHRPAPAYPEASLNNGEEGRVEVQVRVGADGRVREAVVLRSSGLAHMDEAAVAAALGWSCRAAASANRELVDTAMIEFSLP